MAFIFIVFTESAFAVTNYQFFLVSVMVQVYDKIFILWLIFSFHYQTKNFWCSKVYYPTNKKSKQKLRWYITYSSRIYVIITVVIRTNILISLLLIIGFKSYIRTNEIIRVEFEKYSQTNKSYICISDQTTKNLFFKSVLRSLFYLDSIRKDFLTFEFKHPTLFVLYMRLLL